MRPFLIPAALLAMTGSCHSRHVTTTARSEGYARHATRVSLNDSLRMQVEVKLDSPEITVEWLDSPRRRIRARARRAVAAARSEEIATASAEISDSIRSTATASADSRSSPEPGAKWLLRLLAAVAAVVTLLSFLKIRSRR